MNKVLTLWILLFLFLSGCVKETFYFSKVAGETASYKKKKVVQPTSPAQTTVKETETNILSTDVNTGLELTSEKKASKESKLIAHYLTNINKAEIKSLVPVKEKVGLNKSLKKHLPKQLIADEKSVNKKGKAGFILSFIGLGLILFGPIFVPLLAVSFLSSVAGIIFSALGLSEIKKNPNQYSNRNKAKAGLIMGIAAVALTLMTVLVIFLILLLLAKVASSIVIGMYGG